MLITKVPIQALLHVQNFQLRNVEFDLERHIKEKAYCSVIHCKPKRALWTSDYVEPIEEIPWVAHLGRYSSAKFAQVYMGRWLYKIYPKQNVRVFEIRNFKDYLELPLSIVKKRIRYKKLKRLGYDGIHFLGDARKNSKFSKNNKTEYHAFNDTMIAVDCDSYVWFNTKWIDRIELVGQNFHFAPSYTTIKNHDLRPSFDIVTTKNF